MPRLKLGNLGNQCILNICGEHVKYEFRHQSVPFLVVKKMRLKRNKCVLDSPKVQGQCLRTTWIDTRLSKVSA